MQKEEKKRFLKMNAFKKAVSVTKHGSSFAKLLAVTDNSPSNTKTSEDPRDPLIQFLLSLYTDSIKKDFYYLGGKIGDLDDQKKWTVAS